MAPSRLHGNVLRAHAIQFTRLANKWFHANQNCFIETLAINESTLWLDLRDYFYSKVLAGPAWKWKHALVITPYIKQRYVITFPYGYIKITTLIRNILESNPLRWRHNGCDSVSNHQPYDCLLNRLFRRRWKKTSKLRVTGLCAGNPVTRKMSPFDDVLMQ